MIGLDTLDGSPRSILAMLGCLAAALSYGCANVFGRRFKRMGIPSAVGTFGQLAATAVMVAPVALVFDQPWRLPPPTMAVWASTAGLALLSTALAYAIFFRLLARAGTTRVSLVTLLIPVSAIGLGLIAVDGRAWAPLRPAREQRTAI
jgi:drug/metabolite transporter (DMT)-like permease